MKSRIILFFILMGSALGVGFLIRDRLHAKMRAQLVMTTDTVELPFEDYGGHIYLQGKINGVFTKDLILDSGASDLFISAAKAKDFGLKIQPKTSSPNPSNLSATAYSPDVSFTFGGLTLRDRQTALLSEAEVKGLETYFGRPVSGILGYDLFEQLVIEVDYPKKVLRLHRPQSYQYAGNGQRLPLMMEGDRPFIEASVKPFGFPAMMGKFMIDLGSNAALSLGGGCGLNQRLIAAAPRLQRRNLATLKGSTAIGLGRVEQLTLGSASFLKPVTIFSITDQGECNQIRGKIGYQILHPFKVTLDYPHRQLILEPTHFAQPPPYDYDLSGLWLEAIAPTLNRYRVKAIAPDTPAARAGIQVGDQIIKVNYGEASRLTLVQIRQKLSEAGQIVSLVIQRNAKQISVRLQLKPLI